MRKRYRYAGDVGVWSWTAVLCLLDFAFETAKVREVLYQDAIGWIWMDLNVRTTRTICREKQQGRFQEWKCVATIRMVGHSPDGEVKRPCRKSTDTILYSTIPQKQSKPHPKLSTRRFKNYARGKAPIRKASPIHPVHSSNGKWMGGKIKGKFCDLRGCVCNT